MHILYVDDSGSVANATERYFVLGGISVFERGIHHLIGKIDQCVAQFNLGDISEIELHATQIYNGKGQPWSSVRDRPLREGMIHSALDTLIAEGQSVRLFAVAVDKQNMAIIYLN